MQISTPVRSSNLVPSENPAALHVIVSVSSSERLDVPAIHPTQMLVAWVNDAPQGNLTS